MNPPEMKIISASRRLDMVAGYPDLLVKMLSEKCPPERVHTLVLWTKNARNILHYAPLREKLQAYDQLYLHFTITGFGETILEPRVPAMNESLNLLLSLIQFFKSPSRIRIRFDPVVHFVLPNGEPVTNIHLFPAVAAAMAKNGLKNVTTSWVEAYAKVRQRLQKHKIKVMSPSPDQLDSDRQFLCKVAANFELRLTGCCSENLPSAQCIDAELFNSLHPKNCRAPAIKACGQRLKCTCSKSWDIGWYYKCPNGCIYCYGNPKGECE